MKPNHGSHSALLALTVFGLLLAGPATRLVAADTSSLLEVPQPDLSQLEPGVQELILEARAGLDAAIASTATSTADLGEAFGEMGKLYFVYDLSGLSEVCYLNAQTLRPDDFRWPHYLSVIYVLDGELEKALSTLERVLELEPGNHAALTRQGDVLYDLRDLDSAVESYQAALTLHPNNAAAFYGLGRVAALRGDYPTAIESFSTALQLQPAANSIHHALGMAYRQQGDLEQARAQLAQNRGGRVRIEDPLLSQLGSLLQSSQMYFDAGVDAMKSGNYEEALRQFSIARDLKPDDYLIPYNIALGLLRTGQEDEAIKWLQTSVENNPDFRNGHFNLATMLAGRGRLEEAAYHFGEAHRIDPEDVEAHLEFATALGLTGQEDKAITELRALLEIHPNQSGALLNLGILLAQRQQVDEAIRAFSDLIQIGESPEAELAAHLRIATLEAERGMEGSAIGHYRSAIELEPRSVEAYLGLAAALGRTGEFAEAATGYSQVLALDPARMDAHFGRVTALILSEQYDSAVVSLEESLSQPSAPLALKHVLAQLLAACPDAEVRDGDRALVLAQEVFQQEQTLDHAETMAMALAEVGKFAEAVELQSQVVAEAKRMGQADLAKRAQSRLEKYQRDEPVRSPWQGG